MLLHGVKRYVFVTLGLAGATGAVAFALVWLAGASVERAVPVTFYLAGALVMAGGLLLSTSGPEDWMPETGFTQEERESWIASSLVYVAIGAPLIVAGLIIDTVL